MKWLFFAGEGVIAENLRHEQRKVIKYSQLVANMVILHNLHWMSRKLKELQTQGYPVGQPVLKALSPYRTSSINRFGDYTLDLSRAVEPIDYKIKFSRCINEFDAFLRFSKESRPTVFLACHERAWHAHKKLRFDGAALLLDARLLIDMPAPNPGDFLFA